MIHAITIDRAGRIVLPSGVRRQLNLVAGSRLMRDFQALARPGDPLISRP